MSETITPQVIVKNDPRMITGWAFFDWANSAYALVITVAIFPGYFSAMTPDKVHIGSFSMSNSTLYSWCISLGYLIIAFISPILSGIADFGGNVMKRGEYNCLENNKLIIEELPKGTYTLCIIDGDQLSKKRFEKN